MNMIKILIVVFMLAATGWSSAQDVPKTTTFEVLMKNFRMADSAAGTVGFRQCDNCNYQRIRLSPRTQYMVNGERLHFEEFRRIVANLANDGELNVNVRRDDTSGTVASVFISSE